MKEIILATANPGKTAEFQALLAPIVVKNLASLRLESPEETGLSFVENALIKARHASLHTGLAALADDSGLVVPSLHGEPGIYSARYAGENASDADNIAHLLAKLKDIPDEQRQAYFYCALVLVRAADDPTPLIACGLWSGSIAKEAQGENGFGYDPVFYLPEKQCTAAQLPKSLKNTESHRAKALAKMRVLLEEE